MSRTRIKTLELKGVTQRFGDEKPLFHDLTLTLPLGEMLAVEGDPGCGKSLLLKVMAGLISPTGGAVFYNGTDVSQMSFEEFTPMRLSTAFCFDDGGLLMNRTLEENLKMALLYHHGWRSDRSQSLYDELVRHFDLGHHLHLRPAQAASGIRKLAGLARVFLHNAQVLFLDDPSLGIGDKGARALNFWLSKYRREGKHDEVVVITSSDESFIKGLDCTHMKFRDGGLVTTRKVRGAIGNKGAA